MHPSLVAGAPDLVELFRRSDFKESTQFVAEGCLEDTPTDFEKAATCYLNKEQAVWTQWVTTDAGRKARKALRSDCSRRGINRWISSPPFNDDRPSPFSPVLPL